MSKLSKTRYIQFNPGHLSRTTKRPSVIENDRRSISNFCLANTEKKVRLLEDKMLTIRFKYIYIHTFSKD